MALKLIKLTKEYKRQLFEMLDEWTEDIAKNGGNISPFALFKNDYHDFGNYIEQMYDNSHLPEGHVPATTLFLYDEERDVFIGAVNIRHYLNEGLLYGGGHIGDGIRPSERRKGYATKMIGLALQECKKMGIDRVLMSCDPDNIGSKKSIMNNGGVFEDEIISKYGGERLERYWIDNK